MQRRGFVQRSVVIILTNNGNEIKHNVLDDSCVSNLSATISFVPYRMNVYAIRQTVTITVMFVLSGIRFVAFKTDSDGQNISIPFSVARNLLGLFLYIEVEFTAIIF